MAYTMITCMPCEVVASIVDRGAEQKMNERLRKGWGLIHEEMMWRGRHEYSCTHHYCDVSECGCYHRYPGFLLRRVDSGVWLPGEGEIRGEWLEEGEINETPNAVWFDFASRTMGLIGTNIYDIHYN